MNSFFSNSEMITSITHYNL